MVRVRLRRATAQLRQFLLPKLLPTLFPILLPDVSRQSTRRVRQYKGLQPCQALSAALPIFIHLFASRPVDAPSPI